MIGSYSQINQQVRVYKHTQTQRVEKEIKEKSTNEMKCYLLSVFLSCRLNVHDAHL